ncbi:MAG: acyl carrier protein [Ilumatobacter fluminis]|uniref:acyl carrier protein n=1 Tax=Ilumatobacter fluminis TaxID=467091 RepID=UPI0032EFE49B
MNPADSSALVHDLCVFIDDHVSTGDETITPSTELVLSGLVDSLGVVMIVEWIEDRLGREVDPTDVVIEHFETVEAMAAFLGTA